MIAAWNRSDTIARAVLSALAQDEVRSVIVVDDGSIDDTAAMASQCDPEGRRVIVERLRSNMGPSAARNIAIEISKAPWLAILDGDDFFLPGRLRSCCLSRMVGILSRTICCRSQKIDLTIFDRLRH